MPVSVGATRFVGAATVTSAERTVVAFSARASQLSFAATSAGPTVRVAAAAPAIGVPSRSHA